MLRLMSMKKKTQKYIDSLLGIPISFSTGRAVSQYETDVKVAWASMSSG